MSRSWPNIPYDAWRETCSALHLYAQIVGKDGNVFAVVSGKDEERIASVRELVNMALAK